MDDNLKQFFGGFDLAGRRLSDGKLRSFTTGNTIDDWPEEVELFGNVYTKEKVITGKDGYESTIYV